MGTVVLVGYCKPTVALRVLKALIDEASVGLSLTLRVKPLTIVRCFSWDLLVGRHRGSLDYDSPYVNTPPYPILPTSALRSS